MRPTNRARRRHPERDGSPDAPGARSLLDHARELLRTKRQQDDLSVRAENSGHGKKTADKWTQ
jgi:hypothetical protein